MIDVNLDLPGAAFIPRDYVPDMRAKIDLYRRLARCTDVAAVEQIRDGFVDRFGPLPDEVRRFLELVELRIDTAFWQVIDLHIEAPYLVFEYTDAGRARQWVQKSKGRLRIVDDRSIYMTLSADILSDPDRLIETAKSVLRLT